MKRANYIILSLLGLLLIGTSCNKQKTYADRLKAENKAIDKFIAANKFVILKDFPKDGKFGDKDFYRDPATGVYFNIISVGDTVIVDDAGEEHRLKFGDEIYVRFKGLKYFSKNDTTEYNNMNTINSPFPNEFPYRGPVNIETRSYYSGTTPGWFVPLQHVGHNGRVKMIIPFTWGSQSDVQSYTPTYYDLVSYSWWN